MAEQVEIDGNIFFDEESAAHHVEYIGNLRRKKRRKRLTILLILLLILGVPAGYWIFEDIRWSRRIDAQLAEYRAAGQPVEIEDFAPPPTPDDNNAALAYKNAFTLLKLTKKQEYLVEGFPDGFLPEKVLAEMDLMKEAISANEKSLKLIRQARSMTGCDWGIKYRSPAYEILLPSLNQFRSLGKFLRAATVYYHNTGNDTAAVETIRDMLPLANSNRAIFLIGNLVAIEIDDMACEAVEAIVKNLEVTTGQAGIRPGEKQKHPPGRKAVESLIKELLNEKEVRMGMKRSLSCEHAYVFDTFQLWLKGKYSIYNLDDNATISEQINALAFRPWYKREMLSLLKKMYSKAQAPMQKNYSDAKHFWPPLITEEDLIDRSIMINIKVHFMPSMNRLLTLFFRSLAKRRMAAVALAIRLYEIDNGRRPVKLAELVPKYLPEIPEDPFSPQGKPINYRPNLSRPVLYSVGDNQKDEGGKYADSPDEVPYMEKYDIVFFLNGDRPREKP